MSNKTRSRLNRPLLFIAVALLLSTLTACDVVGGLIGGEEVLPPLQETSPEEEAVEDEEMQEPAAEEASEEPETDAEEEAEKEPPVPEEPAEESTAETPGPESGGGEMMPFQPAGATDLSSMTWVEAFDAANAILSAQYAFTEQKDIDWDALHDEFAPRVTEAQAENNSKLLYLALREYAYSIPDGHITIIGDDMGMRADQVGGGYGLTVIGLNDGTVIADRVIAGGPAAGAGMVPGATILEWDGLPIADAVSAASVLWAETPPATNEARLYNQYRFVVRAPVLTATEVVFQNPGESESTATLVAVDDAMETLTLTNPTATDEIALNYATLPSGYGYIRVSALAPVQLLALTPDPTEEALLQAIADELALPWLEAMQAFTAAEVPAIIIDARGNVGGLDAAVPGMFGNLYAELSLYEVQGYYNGTTGNFERDPSSGESELWVEPSPPYYGGAVVTMVDTGTISSGEGIALLTERLPNGEVTGFYGTNGSFGLTSDNVKITFPTGVVLGYPYGQSQDGSGAIQLGSNGRAGGVRPTVRVPLSAANALAAARDEDVELNFVVDWLETNAATLAEAAAPAPPVVAEVPSPEPSEAGVPETGETPETTAPPATSEPVKVAVTYTVQAGDTLGEIADFFETTVDEIVNLNKATYTSLETSPDAIEIGWVLTLPDSVLMTYTVKPADVLEEIAREHGTTIEALVDLNKDIYPSLETEPGKLEIGWLLRVPPPTPGSSQ
jgi:carboxyl-terminal processing protease